MATKIQKVVYGIAGVIAAVVIMGIFFSSGASQQVQQNVVPYVTVSGSATTTGIGTKPVFIDFISDTGVTTSASVSGNSYSITLPNQHSYSTKLHYSAGLGLTSGTCQGGTMSVYSTSSMMSYDISC